ncbi:barstar family protein [Streptomyces coelicoflavus]|uniref:barstar family protein n=1 Tax=Streptomyces coelicoflavus TaxID=285562 RepID=UPI002E271BC1
MTEQGIHRCFAEVLQFPGYYGANWDALVDCLSDLCGEVTGGVGIVGVIHDADLILDTDHFPLFVSVLCQGADRANASVDLDGFPSDRPALSEHLSLRVPRLRSREHRAPRTPTRPDRHHRSRSRRGGPEPRGMALTDFAPCPTEPSFFELRCLVGSRVRTGGCWCGA